MSKRQPEDPTEVRVDLPLPSDVAATLIQIVGMTYPKTKLAEDGQGGLRPHQLVLVIDPKDRFKSAKSRKKYEEAKSHLSQDDFFAPWLTALGPNGVSVGAHEYLVKWWIDLARKSFEDHPIETNYLETEVYDSENQQQYIFHVAKGKGRTPHALRQEAETRAEKAEGEVERLKLELKRLNNVLRGLPEDFPKTKVGEPPSAPKKRQPAASPKRSAKSSTTTRSRGKAGTTKADPSSESGTAATGSGHTP